jgi:chromatin assembly factor 1 subunit B
MKIETPQILWHNGSEGNGKPAPLYSVSLLPKVHVTNDVDDIDIDVDDDVHTNVHTNSHADVDADADAVTDMYMDGATNVNANATGNNAMNESYEILATGGNSNEIHIWKVKLTASHDTPGDSNADTSNNTSTSASTTSSTSTNTNPQCEEPPTKKPKIFSVASPLIDHITTLTRHERSINTVSFSPHGTHLASAGDGGTLIVHTVPSSHRFHPDTNDNRVGGSIKGKGKRSAQTQTPQSFWNTHLQSEKDLSIKLLHTGSEDIMDLSWSQDETRFLIGTLDHSVLVYQEILDSKKADSSSVSGSVSISISTKSWNCVWKNRNEHTHYVQGVAFDPLSVYLASQGSDRSVRVWQRKGLKPRGSSSLSITGTGTGTGTGTIVSGGSGGSGNSSDGGTKKKVLGDQDKNVEPPSNMVGENGHGNGTGNGTGNVHALDVERQLGNKFDVGKAKVLKYRNENTSTNTHSSTSTITTAEEQEEKETNSNSNANDNDNDNINASVNTNTNTNTNTNANANTNVKKRHLFADESSVESFFRRLAWTADGAFLVTPASLWHKHSPTPTESNSEADSTSTTTSSTSSSETSFATYLFARHQFDKPYRVLYGLEKPSVVIRPNPVLFQLPNQVQLDSKENLNSLQSSPSSVASNEGCKRSEAILPYRSIFAVLTVDSILIYDTFHSKPLCIARGLHYAGLTDCSWSSDGHHLVVSSTDGYISMISFEQGELGEVYLDERVVPSASVSVSGDDADVHTHAHAHAQASGNSNNLKSSISAEMRSNSNLPKKHSPPKVKVTLPPCEPGQRAVLVAPPAKKAKTISTCASTSTTTPRTGMVNTLHGRKRVKPVHVEIPKSSVGNDGSQHMKENEGAETGTGTGTGCTVEKDVVGGVTNLSLTSSLQ